VFAIVAGEFADVYTRIGILSEGHFSFIVSAPQPRMRLASVAGGNGDTQLTSLTLPHDRIKYSWDLFDIVF
jgi:hypothetical protein